MTYRIEVAPAAARQLRKLDPSAQRRIHAAIELLRALGALTGEPRNAAITEVGRAMLRLPAHPRYARMMLEAARYGCVREAALFAAIMSGRAATPERGHQAGWRGRRVARPHRRLPHRL